jgi:rhodanese-related sulfurtransferase
MNHRHLLLLAAIATLTGPIARAADPAPATPAPAKAAAAPAQAVAVQPMSQETLLQHLAQHPDHLVLLDVRTPQEFAEGHIAGAVNVPYDLLATRLAEVPKNKDVVLYCRSGRRAGIAAEVLAANGYTRLSHLEGDMIAWTEKGRPVVK